MPTDAALATDDAGLPVPGIAPAAKQAGVTFESGARLITGPSDGSATPPAPQSERDREVHPVS